MKRSILHFARVYAVLLGALDFGTGLGLVFLPAFTLKMMGTAVPGGEALVYVRFIGVFVAAVGATYLIGARGTQEKLRSLFVFTLLFRAGAGVFSAAAVLLGLLDRAWWVVAATDLACVAIQGWLLRQGLDDE